MNFIEKGNGKLKQGFFNPKAPRYGSKPFLGRSSNRNASHSTKDSTLSSKLNWGKSRQNASSFGDHTETSITNDDSRIILALSEGRGEARCEVGLAVINVSQPHLILCQISDTQSYDNTLRKINIFNPGQILVPMTFVESAQQSRLIEKVKEQFPQVTYAPVRRNTYNKTSGMEFIQELCVSSLNSVLLVLQYRYYALTAASALFKFLQNNLNIFYASGSIKIEYQESEGYALIDVSTADRLELVSSTKPLQASKYSTLFGVLNNCYTKIGERALRTLLLQPPFVTSIILERQQCVTALMRNPEKLMSIQVMLQKLGNVDQLLTLPTIVIDDSQSCSTRQLNYILYLNGLVDLIITLSEVVSTFTQSLFKNISVTLTNQEFLNIRDLVRTLIHENAYAAKSHNGLLQRCFAIKPGINGLLDLVRKIYSERLDDMREYVKSLADKYDLPLTLGNNITKGYHIVYSLNKHQRISTKKSDIPKEFIQVCRLAGSFTMKTMELINFQTRIDDIIADILKISNVMIFKTLTSFKKHMGLFYRLCEDIATIDVLQSLAEVSMRNNYIKPTFSDFTEVRESHHPMLEMLAHEKPVPNLISSSDSFNIHIITGPNGSGKSIYIRQVMLLQIMAQIGGYVPASSAVFRPADRLFARVYLEDNMECGASSFVLEMKEIIYILTNITDSSLVIIDELARSTSLEEGSALAMAICERFVKSSAFVYLTSHFTLITKLGDLYLNVKNWFMDADASGDTPQSMQLKFKHSIKTGVTNLKRYGIFMVKNIWPRDLLEDVYSLLELNTRAQKEVKTQRLSKEARLKYKLDADLRKCNAEGKAKPSKMNELLANYRYDIEKLNDMNVVNSNNAGQIKDLSNENSCYFDDTVPDDVLSEAVDQAEYSFSQADSSYKKLSCFIRENSENINLLNPEINIYEHDNTFDPKSSNREIQENINSKPNIKILSNVLLNPNNDNLNNYSIHNNDEFENYSNLRSISQATYENSQEFEEVNEINRSLLEEMHIVKENLNSENHYEKTLMENMNDSENNEFLDSIENDFSREGKIPAEQHSFNSFLREENQESDFCFLKPTEPPLKKIFTFKTNSSMDNVKENLNETDQFAFSSGLNRDKTSTPIIPQKKGQKMNFTNYFESQIENAYSSRNLSSSPRNQVASDRANNLSGSKLSEKYDEIDKQQKYSAYAIKNHQEIENNSTNCDNLDVHIFPQVTIISGPNNKSLSFGEEDKLRETAKRIELKENIDRKNIKSMNMMFEEYEPNKSSNQIESVNQEESILNKTDLEQFTIEETRIFLSNTSDFFDEDMDQLEITVENNESNRKSHEEVSENIISILKEISPRKNHDNEFDDEIIIQNSQHDVEDDAGSDLNEPIFSGTEKNIEILNNPIYNKTSEITHNYKERSPNNNSKFTHNLFEEPDLDRYLDNDLTITKECFQKMNSNEQKSTANPHTHSEEKNEDRNETKRKNSTTTGEKTESTTKNSASTSLSEASRKRKLDNSSTSSSNESDKKDIKETKLDNTSDSKTSSKSFCEKVSSISDASRKRNLDIPLSSDSQEEKDDMKISNSSSSPKARRNLKLESMKYPRGTETNSDDVKDDREKRAKTESNSSSDYYETAVDTDLSSISKRRNLDNAPSKVFQREEDDGVSKCTTETFSGVSSLPFESVEESCASGKLKKTSKHTFLNENQKQDESYDDFKEASIASNDDSLNRHETNSKTTVDKKRKYLGYRRRPKDPQLKKTKKEKTKKSKFTFKPSKLTKYQIQEEFNKQDQIILDENLDVETYNKYLMQRMNRPSVKQIQNAEHIATFRKTENGTIVIPTKKTIHKPRKIPKTFESSKLFDVSIFSDQNAGRMSAFLASNEMNYDQFKFEQSAKDLGGSNDDSLSRSIKFCSQFIGRTKKIEFARSRSFGEFKFHDFSKTCHKESLKFDAASQRSDSSSIFLPNGFFKDNKKDIDDICSKYLGSRFYRNKTSPFS